MNILNLIVMALAFSGLGNHGFDYLRSVRREKTSDTIGNFIKASLKKPRVVVLVSEACMSSNKWLLL